MNFKNSTGTAVSYSDIVSLMQKGYEYQVFVGTDSQVIRKNKKVRYATCIVLYKKGKGGKVFVSRDFKPYANSLRDRLLTEVWRSLETSWDLAQQLPLDTEIVIHVDVNKSTLYKSGNYYQELVSLVTGQGFKVKVKPQAWAAQSVANYFTRKP
jgi:hypothetical protein